MALPRIGPLAQAWYRWRALRLPWRKRFFVGLDLDGNTYWEFGLARGPDAGAPRWRRIVRCPRSTPYSDVRVSPLWHQWLRHARPDAPSLVEQRADVLRQDRARLLAAQADARWEAKPRVAADAAAAPLPPADAGPGPALGPTPEPAQARVADHAGPHAADAAHPWAKAKPRAPGDEWQPTAWEPAAAKKR